MAMPRRIEDKIRKLCKELLQARTTTSNSKAGPKLRAALHLHIERLRIRAANYPWSWNGGSKRQFHQRKVLRLSPAEI